MLSIIISESLQTYIGIILHTIRCDTLFAFRSKGQPKSIIYVQIPPFYSNIHVRTTWLYYWGDNRFSQSDSVWTLQPTLSDSHENYEPDPA